MSFGMVILAITLIAVAAISVVAIIVSTSAGAAWLEKTGAKSADSRPSDSDS